MDNNSLSIKEKIIKFYEQPVKMECDELGLLKFPEDSLFIQRCTLLLNALPNAPEFVKLEEETDEEARMRRRLVNTRWSVLCCSLLLPYCREDVTPNPEQYESIDYWNSIKEEFLQSGGDFPLIFSVCKQKLTLLESVGKKFADFPLTAEDLKLLEECLQARRACIQSKISECSSKTFIYSTLIEQQRVIDKYETKLKECTHVLWKILTLNIDYIPPLTLRTINRGSADIKGKRESIKEHLMSFRLEEYRKYTLNKNTYKLPQKFSSRSVPLLKE